MYSRGPGVPKPRRSRDLKIPQVRERARSTAVAKTEKSAGVQTEQDGNTKDMIWNIPKLIEYASHVMTLHPGDLISTGTPDGVGPLTAGDEVTIEIERIGRMSVHVAWRER